MLALSAWLDRKAGPIVVADPAPDPMSALRRRYPGAPEAWLRQIAARFGSRPLPVGDAHVAAVAQPAPTAPLSWGQPVPADSAALDVRPAVRPDGSQTAPPPPLITPAPGPRRQVPPPQPVFAPARTNAPAPPVYAPARGRAAPPLPHFSQPPLPPALEPSPQPVILAAADPVPEYRLPVQTAPTQDPPWSLAAPRPAPTSLRLQPAPDFTPSPPSFTAPPPGRADLPAPRPERAPVPPQATRSYDAATPDHPVTPDWPAAVIRRADAPAFASPDPTLWPALPPCGDDANTVDPEAAMPARWAAPRPDQEARIWNG